MQAKSKSSVSESRINLGESVPLNSPLVLYVELSGFCNLKCKFCPHYIDPDNLIKDTMSQETFDNLILGIKGLKKIKVIRLIGTGEPLLNKKFLAFAQQIKEANVCERLELTTNALLLKKEEYRLNLTKYLDKIIISIEGLDEQAYLDVAGTKIKFEELVKNIHLLYQNKRNCNIYIKIHNSAIKDEMDLKKFHKFFGNSCDEIFVENLVNLWPETISNLGFDAGYRFGGEAKPQKVCTQIFKSMMVNANGDVVPCCVDFKRVNKISNINEEPLSIIWNSKKMNSMRQMHLLGKGGEISPCNDCSYYQSDPDNIDDYANDILARI